MKRLISLVFIILLAIGCCAQTDSISQTDSSTSVIDPLLILSFEQVKNKNLDIPTLRFYSIKDYQKVFSMNLNTYMRTLKNQTKFLNYYTNFTGDLYFKHPFRYNERNPEFLNYPDYHYDPLNPWGVNDFSDGVVMGSLNFIIYQLFNK